MVEGRLEPADGAPGPVPQQGLQHGELGHLLHVRRGLFGALFLMSQFLQSGLGDSPLRAGLHLLPGRPFPCSSPRSWTPSPTSTATVPSWRSAWRCRPSGSGGSRSRHAGVTFGGVLAGLLVAGVGIGIVFPTVANGVMTSVGPEETGIASGTSATLRELGVSSESLSPRPSSRTPATTHRTRPSSPTSAMRWLCAAFSAAGIFVSLAYPAHRTTAPVPPVPPGANRRDDRRGGPGLTPTRHPMSRPRPLARAGGRGPSEAHEREPRELRELREPRELRELRERGSHHDHRHPQAGRGRRPRRRQGRLPGLERRRPGRVRRRVLRGRAPSCPAPT